METTKNKFGLLHSIDDKPSLIDDEGNQYWYKDGKIHRNNDLPSIIMNNGDLYWYKDGLLHRDNDMPSIIMNNGDKYWHINGMQSRSDMSLPYVEKSNGYKEYRLENNGYKVISKQKEVWFNKDNNLHREDGPAYIEYYVNGKIYIEAYYINGIFHNQNGTGFIKYY
jgi:hypothetical protein